MRVHIYSCRLKLRNKITGEVEDCRQLITEPRLSTAKSKFTTHLLDTHEEDFPIIARDIADKE